jgi:hypothetical protein
VGSYLSIKKMNLLGHRRGGSISTLKTDPKYKNSCGILFSAKEGGHISTLKNDPKNKNSCGIIFSVKKGGVIFQR